MIITSVNNIEKNKRIYNLFMYMINIENKNYNNASS